MNYKLKIKTALLNKISPEKLCYTCGESFKGEGLMCDYCQKEADAERDYEAKASFVDE